MQRRGMARIQRTHHPIFAGSLETSTFSPVEGAAAPGISASDAAKGPPPQLEPAAEANTQVNQQTCLPCIPLLYAMVQCSASLGFGPVCKTSEPRGEGASDEAYSSQAA